MNNDGTRKGTKTLGTISPVFKIVAVEDFNGDGISDIFWRQDNGRNIIWYMNSDGSLQMSKDIGTVPTSYSIVNS